MRADAPVGIVGGYGAVGRAAARLLKAWRVGPLRIGGRRVDLARRFVQDELGPIASPAAVDVEDPADLAEFCTGCRVVVNCTGPSYRLVDRVALAAFAAGADYVDPGGDAPVHRRLVGVDLASAGRTAVLTAGLMPGLTGLLPVWLSRQGFDRATRLTAYVGLVDHLTPAGAGDYLLSLGDGHGEAQAAWRNGARVSRALEPLTEVELPMFPGRVTAYPYLSAESERLARSLGLDEVRWYNVFDGGGQILAALSRLRGAMVGEGDLDVAAAKLVQAAELDLFGRTPYQLLVFQLDGEADHRPRIRTLVMRGNDTYGLTGAVTAIAVAAVLNGEVAPGLYFAADALDPGTVVERLRSVPAVRTLKIMEGPAEGDHEVEEGAV
jgi:hypothetical protein